MKMYKYCRCWITNNIYTYFNNKHDSNICSSFEKSMISRSEITFVVRPLRLAKTHVSAKRKQKHDSEPLPDTDSVSGSSESAVVVVVAVGVVSSGKHDTVLV